MSLPFPELLIAAAWGVAVAVLSLGIQRGRRANRKRARFATLQLGPGHWTDGSPTERRDVRRFVAALGKSVSARTGATLDKLVSLVDGAGLTGQVAPAEILGWQLILSGLGLSSAFVLAFSNLVVGLLLAAVLTLGGWSSPLMWLRIRRQQRIKQILRELPPVIDLLSLSLEAGMGLDRAIGMICDRMRSPLSEELQRVLTDVGLGISRQEAFERFSERSRSDDVRLFSSSIIQSEQLGSSLVTAVKSQARLLRVARRRQAETLALKAPVKMLFPMVMFILPTLFLVILGPAGLNMAGALSQGHP